MTEEQIKRKAIKASDKKCVKGCSKYYRYGDLGQKKADK